MEKYKLLGFYIMLHLEIHIKLLLFTTDRSVKNTYVYPISGFKANYLTKSY